MVGKRRRRRRRRSEEDEAAAWWCVLLESAASSLARIFVLSSFFRFCVSLDCCVLVLSISWEKSRMTSLKYIQKISAQVIEVEDPLPKKKSNSIFFFFFLSLSLNGAFLLWCRKIDPEVFARTRLQSTSARICLREQKKGAPPHRVVVVKTSDRFDAHVIQALGHFTSHTNF